jgi:hypothetical protein
MFKSFKLISLLCLFNLISALNLGNIHYSSAGAILRVKIGSKYYLLLAKEKHGAKAGTFDSFSGQRDRGEKPWQTAGREFYEESAAALGKLDYYKKLTSKAKAVMGLMRHGSKTQASGINYLIDLDKKQYQSLVQNFYKNLKNKKLSHVFKEKSQLALFEESQVKSMIKNNANRHNFRLNALIVDSKLNYAKITIDDAFWFRKKSEMKDMTKNMNQEQKEKYKEDLIKKKKDEEVKLKLEKKLLKDKEKKGLYLYRHTHSY